MQETTLGKKCQGVKSHEENRGLEGAGKRTEDRAVDGAIDCGCEWRRCFAARGLRFDSGHGLEARSLVESCA